MSELSYAEERDMDDRFEAHQDRLAEEQEQAERLGFDVDERVTVGKGKVQWTILAFTTYRASGVYAHLESLDGRSHNTAHVDRLKAVQS